MFSVTHYNTSGKQLKDDRILNYDIQNKYIPRTAIAYAVATIRWQMDDLCLELTIHKIEGTPNVPSRLLLEETFIKEAIEEMSK
jgi:hypothetical protein